MKKRATSILLCCFSYAALAQVGIGTTDPAAGLHVENKAVVFSAPLAVSSETASASISGSGRRLLWLPGKAAFMAGAVMDINWTTEQVGEYSFATGSDAQARASHSVAIGYSSAARADFSTALGTHLNAETYGTTVFGRYNRHNTDNSRLAWRPQDDLFVIGNGDPEIRRNALTMLKNGNTGFGVDVPVEKLEVAGLVKTEGVKLPAPNGTPAVLNHYEELSMTSSLRSSTTVFVENYTIELVRIGRSVTLTLPATQLRLNVSQREISFDNIPENFRPSEQLSFPVRTVSGGLLKTGVLLVYPGGRIAILPDMEENVWGGANSGFWATSVSYVIKQ